MKSTLNIHYVAMANPRGMETPIIRQLRSWELFAYRYEEKAGHPIGDNEGLSSIYMHCGLDILSVLNRLEDIGRLHRPTIFNRVKQQLKAQGVWTIKAGTR